MNVANKAWRTRGFCLVAATVLAVVGAWTLREPLFALATHGLTWDERMENRSLRQQVETFDRHWHPQDYAGRPEKPYLAYHGVVNKLPGLFLWRIAQVARGEPPGDFMMGETMLVGMHLSCLLFLLVTVWAVHGCALAWSGSTAVARLAALLLLLHPRFVGQAFFNVKDVPFAALYTLVTWGTVAMVRAVDDGGVRRGFVRALVAASLLAATKIVGAVATWPLVAAAWWPARLASQTPSRGDIRTAGGGSLRDLRDTGGVVASGRLGTRLARVLPASSVVALHDDAGVLCIGSFTAAHLPPGVVRGHDSVAARGRRGLGAARLANPSARDFRRACPDRDASHPVHCDGGPALRCRAAVPVRDPGVVRRWRVGARAPGVGAQRATGRASDRRRGRRFRDGGGRGRQRAPASLSVRLLQ